jgi:hypothetical protein
LRWFWLVNGIIGLALGGWFVNIGVNSSAAWSSIIGLFVGLAGGAMSLWGVFRRPGTGQQEGPSLDRHSQMTQGMVPPQSHGASFDLRGAKGTQLGDSNRQTNHFEDEW